MILQLMKGLPVICVRGAFLFLLYACITSCAGSKSTSEATVGGVEQTEDQAQIIFLNYSIKKNTGNVPHIEFISKIVAEGNLKSGLMHHAEPREGDLNCLTLDENKRPLSSILVPDPLKRRVEYQQEDGSLTTRELSLDSTVFSVRMQLENASRYVAVKRSDSPGGSYLILTEIK